MHYRRKTPIVTIDKTLEKLKYKPLLQEKIDKTNEMLKNVGLPKLKGAI